MRQPRQVLKRWSTDQLITGVEISQWVNLLKENAWNVSPTYFHRAAWVSAWSIPATLLGRIEDATYGRQLASTELQAPIFVIGHWRSGTTHLHNLLGRMPGHTYSNVYQVVFPTAFLMTRNLLPKITAGLLTETRTYDNVQHGWEEAAEDEIALAKLCGLSPYIAFMFPERAAAYERFIDFQEATPQERETWMNAFRYFLKKVAFASGGDRLVVKSCIHSARIRLILEMFPDAKFVHIHRNPYEVYASTLHMRDHTDWENFFQLPDEDDQVLRARQTLLMGERVFERLVDDRRLIPEGNFYEIAYRDLVGNEHAVMKDIYETLDLPGWVTAEPVLEGYLDKVGDYRPNKLQIDDRVKDRVYQYWQQAFEAFGYSREYPEPS